MGRKKDGGAWTAALGEEFLALLRETGNARGAARRLGHPNLFHNRKRRDPAFRRAWQEAAAAADRGLRGARNAFPHALAPRRGFGTVTLPSRKGDSKVTVPAEDLGGFLRPGRKRRQEAPEPVIRRTSNGRTQISFAREGQWTSAIEADFLARLEATGNFDASARAVGFQPASVHQRARKWAAFKEACDAALETASVALNYRLVAHAHALLRLPGETRPPGEAEVDFDPEEAMRILGFIDRRRAGRTTGGRRGGDPQRAFDEAVDNVLGKIAAIERHEAMRAARAAAADEGDGDAVGGGGAAGGGGAGQGREAA